MDGTTEIVGSLMILFVIVILSRRHIKRVARQLTKKETETNAEDREQDQ